MSSRTTGPRRGVLDARPPRLRKPRRPDFAFLIESVATKQRVMFDLGPRKDLENAAPFVAEAVEAGTMALPARPPPEAAVDVNSISAVIRSHSHVDHTGDMSKYPSTTDLVFGKDLMVDTHESNPHSTVLASDLAGRKLVPLDFNTQLEIGGFKAHDFFGDGSFYVLDVPGHQTGHVCALARVTTTSFVLLCADICHHAGVLRPTSHLHSHLPCPGEVLAAARRSISPAHFAPLDSAGGFDLAARTTPLLDIAEDGYFEDASGARASIQKIAAFDANADVFVVLSHDGSLGPVIGPFPASLEQWKVKNWKEKATWAFVDEKNPAFRFKPLDGSK
ncbi:hypothetical protein DFH09DRAFT_1358773 [Mycena vulgaris]|nr:hypothetical protein DFH09DRAFT_1358773 [Mycena vulgaris]